MSETRRGRRPRSVRTSVAKSLTYGTTGLITTTSLAPASTAMSRLVVEIEPPVHQLAAVESHGGVDHRQRPGGAHGGGDRVVLEALRAEHDPLAGVEVGGGDVQLPASRAARGSRRCGRARRAPCAGSPRCRRRCTARRAAPGRARARGPSPRPAPAGRRPGARARRGAAAAARPRARSSPRLGRSRSPRSMSRNGWGASLVATRIISSGVTPLAQSAAMNAPAEVPT